MLIITFKDGEAIADARSLIAVINRVFDYLVPCTLFSALHIAAENGGRPQELIDAIHAAFEAS